MSDPSTLTLDFSIRRASQADLDTISELAHEIWHQHYPSIITTAQIDYMLARDYAITNLEQDLARGVKMDLLVVAGEVAGFSAHEATGRPGEIKLHKLYLQPRLHGHGLGSALLTHVEQQVRDGGFTRIALQVNKRNDKAIRAYLRNGYVTEQAIVVDIGEGFVMDDFLMVKTI